MDSKKDNICKIFALIMMYMYIGTATSTNIDCDGKAFHCVNATHFMICVDLGAGVSQTVDDFMVKCPPTTACRSNNNFECEYQLPTTTQSIIHPSDETKNDTIPSKATTVMKNDITNRNNPIKKSNVTRLSSDYHNTVDVTIHTNEPEIQTENSEIPGNFGNNEAVTSNDDFEFIMDDGQNNNNSFKLLISSKDKNLSELINLAVNTSDIQNVTNRDDFMSPMDVLPNTTIEAATRNAFTLPKKELLTLDSTNSTESKKMSTKFVPIKTQTTSFTFYPIINNNKTIKILVEEPLTASNITQVDNLVIPEEFIPEITTVKQTENTNFNDKRLTITEQTTQKEQINVSLPYELNVLNKIEKYPTTTPSTMSEPTFTPTDYVDDTNQMIISTTASIYNLNDNRTVLLKYNNETAIPAEEFTSTSDEINIKSTSNYIYTTDNSILATDIDLPEKNIQEMVRESTLTSLNLNDINTLLPDDLMEVTSGTTIDNSQFNQSIPYTTTKTSDLNLLGQIIQDHMNVNSSLTHKENISEVILENNISTIDDSISNFSVTPTFYTTNNELKTPSQVTTLDSSLISAESTTISSNYVQDPRLETTSSATLNSVSSRSYVTDTENNPGIETDMTYVFDDYVTHEILTTTNKLDDMDQGIGIMVTESLNQFPNPTEDQKLLPKQAKRKGETSAIGTETTSYYDTSITVNAIPTSVINLKEHIIQDKIASHDEYNMSETSFVTDVPLADTYIRDLSDNTDFTTSSLSTFEPGFMERVTDGEGLGKITTVPRIHINEMETFSLHNESPKELFSKTEDNTQTTNRSWHDIIFTSTDKQDPVESGHDHVNLVETTTEATQAHNDNYKNHNDYTITLKNEKRNEKVFLAGHDMSIRENSNTIYGTTEETIYPDKVTAVPSIDERISINSPVTEVTVQHQQALNDILQSKVESTTEIFLWDNLYLRNTDILITDDTPIPSTLVPLTASLTLEEISTTDNQMNPSRLFEKYFDSLPTKTTDVLMNTENNDMNVSGLDLIASQQNNKDQEKTSHIIEVGLTSTLLAPGKQSIDEILSPKSELNYSISEGTGSAKAENKIVFEKSDKTSLSNWPSPTSANIDSNNEVMNTDYDFETSITQQAFNDIMKPTLQDEKTTETSLWETSHVAHTEMLVSNDKAILSTPKPLEITLIPRVDEILSTSDQINTSGLSKKHLNLLNTNYPNVVMSNENNDMSVSGSDLFISEQNNKAPSMLMSTENNDMSMSVQNNEDQETSSHINDVGLTTILIGLGQNLINERPSPKTELNYSISEYTESAQAITTTVFEKSDKTYSSSKSTTTFKSIKPHNEMKIPNYDHETSITDQAFYYNIRPTLQDQITTETYLMETSYIPNTEMLAVNNQPMPSRYKTLATILTSKADELVPIYDQMNIRSSINYLSSSTTENPGELMSTENNGMNVSIQNNENQVTSSYMNDVGLTTNLLTPGQQLINKNVTPETELNYAISEGAESIQAINTIIFEKSNKTHSPNKSSTTLSSIKANNVVKITNDNLGTSITDQAFKDIFRPILQDQVTMETSLWQTSYVPNTEKFVNEKPIPSTSKSLATTLTSKVDEILPIHDQLNNGLLKNGLNSLSTENPGVLLSTENNAMSVSIHNNEDQETSSYISDVDLSTTLLAQEQQLIHEKVSPEIKLNDSISKGTYSIQPINKIAFEKSDKTTSSNKSSTTFKSMKPSNEVKITNYNIESSTTQQTFNDIIRRKDEITTETSLRGTSYLPNTEILVTDDTPRPSTVTPLPTTFITKVDETSNDQSDNTYSSKQSSTTLRNIKANNKVKITNHNFSAEAEQTINLVTINTEDTIGATDKVTKEATPINVVNQSKLQPNVRSTDYPGYINNTMAVNYTTDNNDDNNNTITTTPIPESSIILQHIVENTDFHIKSNQFNTSNKDRVSNKRSVLVNTEMPLYVTLSKIENNQLITNNKTRTTLITELDLESNTSKNGVIKSNFQTVLKGMDDKYLDKNGVNNISDKQNSTRTSFTPDSNIIHTPPGRYEGSTTTESYQPEVQVFPEISSPSSFYDKFNQTLQNDNSHLTSTNGSSNKPKAFDKTKANKNITLITSTHAIVNETILATTSKVEIKPSNNINVSMKANQSSVTNLFTCKNHLRGRFADKDNCRKYYICIGKIRPIFGQCPINTVFSEIKKQCTKNLSHCIRNNQFRCIQEGRFSDVLRSNIYYICVSNNKSYVRFQFQCLNGFHLNKTSVRCVNDRKFNSQTVSMSLDNSNKGSDQSTVEGKSKEKIKVKEDAKYTCKREGKFPVSEDCRRYYVCSKTSKSVFRRRTKKCDSDEVFHREKKKCVDRDSYECS